ncbi:N-terminal phage integrase SAM-like domain-containing protein [Kitasatospora griseola]|uniref:N-terminal phage integrase SAM-like domain-containing protein n=1 Tax=Kitasatospora griseola TaxID=2064 RepID=UPI00128B9A14|nr:N-terminal phage integrase SAM-like domain-containing protein [Kitasatospora griseola]
MRTPLHLNPATGKRERYWIGREYPTKTAAEKALSKWHTDHEAGQIRVSSDMRLGEWLDKWLTNLRREGTTLAGYETKVRLHIKPHIGTVKLKEVTSDVLDDLYRLLETAPCPTNKGKPLGKKSVRHVHNILSGALGGAVVKKLIPSNPARPRPRAPRHSGRSRGRNRSTRPWTMRRLPGSWQRCGSCAGTASAARITTASGTRRCGPSSQ